MRLADRRYIHNPCDSFACRCNLLNLVFRGSTIPSARGLCSVVCSLVRLFFPFFFLLSSLLRFFPSFLLSFFPSFLLSFFPSLLLCFFASLILCFFASLLLCFFASLFLSFFPSFLPFRACVCACLRTYVWAGGGAGAREWVRGWVVALAGACQCFCCFLLAACLTFCLRVRVAFFPVFCNFSVCALFHLCLLV